MDKRRFYGKIISIETGTAIMKYKTIADVSHLENRICIYMKFTPTAVPPLQFAGKSQIQNEITSIKDVSFPEVLAWLGFTDLTFALFADQNFSKRYRTSVHTIHDNQLIINIINDLPYFFYKTNKEWIVTEDLSDLLPHFNDNLPNEIESILGTSFMKKYNEQVKEKEACLKISAEYEQQKQELINEAKKAKEQSNETESATAENA